RQGCDRFVRPLRSEVLWIATRGRLLDVGRHHATVEKADAIFGSIWNEFLEKVVASPFAPRGVVRDHRLAASARALTLLGDDAIGAQQVHVGGSGPRQRCELAEPPQGLDLVRGNPNRVRPVQRYEIYRQRVG